MTGQIAVSVKTAAALTELSETTVRAAIDAQALPAFRVGRSIRIRTDELNDWFSSLVRVGSEEDR
ncbi:helix-turn-helix domain-containing protein [Nocardioides kribbensis]|uniref:helix-turn-helix domain-containing protein n=1 Tax=Nocardioides kribbensis TaxID=305517 RepID=UPI0018791A15|nr:helix-turn-helix domain-containing protein [Nocardioides kribbensis]